MLFVSYWFVAFAAIFFPTYWMVRSPLARMTLLLAFGALFYTHFAGPGGVVPIVTLGAMTYLAGRSKIKLLRLIVIAICVAALVFCKYTLFFLQQGVAWINPQWATDLVTVAESTLLPSTPPLAISFFVFEFVHYLADVYKGATPIGSPLKFTLFCVFWPSVVAGPIKRYEQFVPALDKGAGRVTLEDAAAGFARVMIGYMKKVVIADNLTAYVDFWQPRFADIDLVDRWLVFAAIALRILFDFSGYSDIAIGMARMMGIKLPENFNWPYLATSVQDFWRRWHISLSTWIRDYVYIPLGGSRYGAPRRLANGLIAFALCGLWHGASWNFAFWGVYHGVGLVVSAGYVTALGSAGRAVERFLAVAYPLKWVMTMLFVAVGWLFFFYPFGTAISMLQLLFTYRG